MKTLKLYIFLIVGVVILAAAAATLTQMLMTMPIPQVEPAKTNRNTSPGSDVTTASMQTTIRLNEPEQRNVYNTTDWRDRRKQLKQPEFTPPPVTNSPGIGIISSIRGTAKLISSDNRTINLRTDQRININDKIITGPDSQIEITFDDGSIISQGENSAMVIDEFLYSPNEPEKNHFTVRIIKGVCRSVSGMITNLNPDRYKVKTRMATIGIRGCDLIFKSTRLKDEIYVLDLAGKKQVIIETTTNGSPVRDPARNQELPIDQSIQKNIIIEQPNQMVTLEMSAQPLQAEATQTTIRRMIDLSSMVKPAKYDLIQSPDSMVIDIKTTPNN